MAPIWNRIQENAIEPYVAEEISYQEMGMRHTVSTTIKPEENIRVKFRISSILEVILTPTFATAKKMARTHKNNDK